MGGTNDDFAHQETTQELCHGNRRQHPQRRQGFEIDGFGEIDKHERGQETGGRQCGDLFQNGGRKCWAFFGVNGWTSGKVVRREEHTEQGGDGTEGGQHDRKQLEILQGNGLSGVGAGVHSCRGWRSLPGIYLEL